MRAFRGLRGDPAGRYDAVIVGAGIGGLVCANLLARDGLRVLLVEQHYMVGGYCSTFRRKGYTFDAATHFYPLLGNPSTLTGALLADLGVPTAWVKMDPVDHIHLPDGSSFAVPADFDAYRAKLDAAFPHERAGVSAFFEQVRQAYLYGLLFHFRGRRHEKLAPLEPLTVREAIDRHVRDPKLRLILAGDCGHWGSPPARTSFVFDSMLRLSYFLGNYYPAGGSQRFADDLAAVFEQRGGHILTSARVSRITLDAGTASGVDIEVGYGRHRHAVHVRAGHVVSNADLRLTLESMVGSEHVPPEVLASARALRPTYPCFLVHIGLADVPLDALVPVSGYHWSSWDAEDVATDAFKVFLPTAYEPAMAPPGGQVVILQRLTAVDYDAVTDWTAHKREIEEGLMRRLALLVPGIERRIVVRTSASAWTSHRYTLNLHGAMLGWEMSPDQLGDRRPPIHTAIPGLSCVGHWTRPGGGITPVIVSAMRAASDITGATPEWEPSP